jgi:hypothetical protein
LTKTSGNSSFSDPTLRIASAVLILCSWAFASFFCSLFINKNANQYVLALALLFGFRSLVSYIRERKAKTSGSDSTLLHKILSSSFCLALALIPYAISGSKINNYDSFNSAQSLWLQLPIDNSIPWILAQAVGNDLYKIPMVGDWLGSDRPPLQAGFILLFLPLNFGLISSEFAYAISFAVQGIWILGALCFLLSLGVNPRNLKLPTLTAGLSGTVIVNSIYTWPKLLAAGLSLCAAGIIFRAILLNPIADHTKLSEISRRPNIELMIGGLILGYSLQSHGTSAFPALALVIIITIQLIFRAKLGRVSQSVLIPLGALVAGAILLQIPWAIWGKFYDPPGNRLIKWHLAGDIGPNDTSFLASVVASYSKLTFIEFLKMKLQNLEALISIPGTSWNIWGSLFSTPSLSRTSDFFSLLPSVSITFPTLLVSLASARQIYMRAAISSLQLKIALTWLFLTLFLFVSLMFIPGSTINHHGSYAINLAVLLIVGSLLNSLRPTQSMLVLLFQTYGILRLYSTMPVENLNIFLISMILIIVLNHRLRAGRSAECTTTLKS